MKNKLFNRWDISLVIIICALCLMALAFRGGGAVAEIYENGEITSRIDLTEISESYTIIIHTGSVLVEHGRIRYLGSQCPDGLCVKRGWLSEPGDVAACVPGKTVICIRGSSRGGAHAVTY